MRSTGWKTAVPKGCKSMSRLVPYIIPTPTFSLTRNLSAWIFYIDISSSSLLASSCSQIPHIYQLRSSDSEWLYHRQWSLEPSIQLCCSADPPQPGFRRILIECEGWRWVFELFRIHIWYLLTIWYAAALFKYRCNMLVAISTVPVISLWFTLALLWRGGIAIKLMKHSNIYFNVLPAEFSLLHHAMRCKTYPAIQHPLKHIQFLHISILLSHDWTTSAIPFCFWKLCFCPHMSITTRKACINHSIFLDSIQHSYFCADIRLRLTSCLWLDKCELATLVKALPSCTYQSLRPCYNNHSSWTCSWTKSGVRTIKMPAAFAFMSSNYIIYLYTCTEK